MTLSKIIGNEHSEDWDILNSAQVGVITLVQLLCPIAKYI